MPWLRIGDSSLTTRLLFTAGTRETMADTFKSERIPSTFNSEFSPKGQHIELGIAEMNLFILLSALGLSHAINGERLLPIGTLYDPFIARGLDALNYACYQDARFIVVATPSGITLGPEGGAHQSIAQPLIGMAQDGLAAFEPAFVDELAAILQFAFGHIQKEGDGAASERNWLRDETGGSVYLRLSTRQIEQIKRAMTPELRQAIMVDLPRKRLVLTQHHALAALLRQEDYEQALIMPRTWKATLAPFLAGIPVRTGFFGEARLFLRSGPLRRPAERSH